MMQNELENKKTKQKLQSDHFSCILKRWWIQKEFSCNNNYSNFHFRCCCFFICKYFTYSGVGILRTVETLCGDVQCTMYMQVNSGLYWSSTRQGLLHIKIIFAYDKVSTGRKIPTCESNKIKVFFLINKLFTIIQQVQHLKQNK